LINSIARKTLVITTIVIAFFGMQTGCSKEGFNVDSKDTSQVIFAIFPTGTLSESYCFTVNADGELTIEKGTRNGRDIAESSFIEKCEASKHIQLAQSDINIIFDLVGKIYASDFDTGDAVLKDSWEVQILYKDKIIKQNYWGDSSPEMKELVDAFIIISPIEVDLHGWS